jgi:hypothetical protein
MQGGTCMLSARKCCSMPIPVIAPTRCNTHSLRHSKERPALVPTDLLCSAFSRALVDAGQHPAEYPPRLCRGAGLSIRQRAQFAPKTGQLFDMDAEGGLDAQLAALMGAQGGGSNAALLAALATPCAAHAQLDLRVPQ